MDHQEFDAMLDSFLHDADGSEEAKMMTVMREVKHSGDLRHSVTPEGHHSQPPTSKDDHSASTTDHRKYDAILNSLFLDLGFVCSEGGEVRDCEDSVVSGGVGPQKDAECCESRDTDVLKETTEKSEVNRWQSHTTTTTATPSGTQENVRRRLYRNVCFKTRPAARSLKEGPRSGPSLRFILGKDQRLHLQEDPGGWREGEELHLESSNILGSSSARNSGSQTSRLYVRRPAPVVEVSPAYEQCPKIMVPLGRTGVSITLPKNAPTNLASFVTPLGDLQKAPVVSQAHTTGCKRVKLAGPVVSCSPPHVLHTQHSNRENTEGPHKVGDCQRIRKENYYKNLGEKTKIIENIIKNPAESKTVREHGVKTLTIGGSSSRMSLPGISIKQITASEPQQAVIEVHSVVMGDDGTVRASGPTTTCVLVPPTQSTPSHPQPVRGKACDGGHNVVVADNGTVRATGSSSTCVLVPPTHTTPSHPQPVRGVASGGGHSVVVGDDGTVRTTGPTTPSMLAHSTPSHPQPVRGEVGGGGHSVVVGDDGTGRTAGPTTPSVLAHSTPSHPQPVRGEVGGGGHRIKVQSTRWVAVKKAKQETASLTGTPIGPCPSAITTARSAGLSQGHEILVPAQEAQSEGSKMTQHMANKEELSSTQELSLQDSAGSCHVAGGDKGLAHHSAGHASHLSSHPATLSRSHTASTQQQPPTCLTVYEVLQHPTTNDHDHGCSQRVPAAPHTHPAVPTTLQHHHSHTPEGCTCKGRECRRGQTCSCMRARERCGLWCGCGGLRCTNLYSLLWLLRNLPITSDSCLLHNFSSYTVESLETLLQSVVVVPCCGRKVPLREVVPGDRSCPCCALTLTYSWCSHHLHLRSLCPRNHCLHCATCRPTHHSHCGRCGDCTPQDVCTKCGYNKQPLTPHPRGGSAGM